MSAWAAVAVALAAIIIDRVAAARSQTRAAAERARQDGERDGRLLQVLDELRRIGTDHEVRIRADHDAILELQRSRH